MNTCIVAAGEKFDVGSRVVLWDDFEGLSFYKYNVKYGKRDVDLNELRKQIDSFVLHHSVTYTAKQTYNALLGRNLSVNFIIGDDNIDGVATIYQCLDIKDAGQSQTPFNNRAPGVEISYHVEAWSKPGLYSDHNVKVMGVQPHQVVTDTVHGSTLKVFAPTDAQVKAVVNLLVGFCNAFPAVNCAFPKGPDGKVARTLVRNPHGLLAHFQITTNKIDPAGFPFEEVEKQVRELTTYGK